MDNAEAPDPYDGIFVAGPVDVQTQVRQAAGTVAVRRAEDVTIQQAFRNVVNEPGSEGCGVCWVLSDGNFVRHLVIKCPTILQHKLCFDCIRPRAGGRGREKTARKCYRSQRTLVCALPVASEMLSAVRFTRTRRFSLAKRRRAVSARCYVLH
jgi:hypothetical protein